MHRHRQIIKPQVDDTEHSDEEWTPRQQACFPNGLADEESAFSAGGTGDVGSIHQLRRSPGEGNGNPLQYPCLENPLDKKSLVDSSPKGHTESTRLGDQEGTLLHYALLVTVPL